MSRFQKKLACAYNRILLSFHVLIVLLSDVKVVLHSGVIMSFSSKSYLSVVTTSTSPDVQGDYFWQKKVFSMAYFSIEVTIYRASPRKKMDAEQISFVYNTRATPSLHPPTPYSILSSLTPDRLTDTLA